MDEAALAVALLAGPALAARAPRLALLDLAPPPGALRAALALAHLVAGGAGRGRRVGRCVRSAGVVLTHGFS